LGIGQPHHIEQLVETNHTRKLDKPPGGEAYRRGKKGSILVGKGSGGEQKTQLMWIQQKIATKKKRKTNRGSSTNT